MGFQYSLRRYFLAPYSTRSGRNLCENDPIYMLYFMRFILIIDLVAHVK